jgi:hypothetical protein
LRKKVARCVLKVVENGGRSVTSFNLHLVVAAVACWNPFSLMQHLSQTDLDIASWFGCPRGRRLPVMIAGRMAIVTICR